jgi:hypothetical protein
MALNPVELTVLERSELNYWSSWKEKNSIAHGKARDFIS